MIRKMMQLRSLTIIPRYSLQQNREFNINKDYYRILELDVHANQSLIQQSYSQLLQQYQQNQAG